MNMKMKMKIKLVTDAEINQQTNKQKMKTENNTNECILNIYIYNRIDHIFRSVVLFEAFIELYLYIR